MRGLIIIFFTVLISQFAASQQVLIGIHAGVCLASMHETYLEERKHSKNKPGLIVGLAAEMPAFQNFKIQSEINLVQKGFEQNSSSPGYVVTDELSLNYIEIPFNLLYYHDFQKWQVFVGPGLSVAYAISGKGKSGINQEVAYTLHFGNNVDEDDLRAFDFGANFFAGIQTKSGILVGINYNLGLNSLIPGDYKNGTLKNNYLGFRVGYMLGSLSKIFH